MKLILLLLCTALCLSNLSCVNGGIPPETKVLLGQIGREVATNAILAATGTSLQLTRLQLQEAQSKVVRRSAKAPQEPESGTALVLSAAEQSVLKDLSRLLLEADVKLGQISPGIVETTLVSPEP